MGVSLKEFRAQRVEILTHTAVIFTSRTTVDSFFHICEEARITVPETMKYICQTEAVALYLQKYIVYRKRKISFADGSFTSFIELIIKHKDEKFLLALSEPHKPELPADACQAQAGGRPRHPGTHGGFGTRRRTACGLRTAGALFAFGRQDPCRQVWHRKPARRGGIRRRHAARRPCGRHHGTSQRPDPAWPRRWPRPSTSICRRFIKARR